MRRVAGRLSPTRAEIAAAVPAGHRRACDQVTWRNLALSAVEAQGWYANRAAHYTAVCRRLALHMDWHSRLTRTGHGRIAAETGVSTDTVARCVAWLQSIGLLGTVAPGRMANTLRCNLVPVYVLTTPGRLARRSPAPCVAAGQGRFADPSSFRRKPCTSPTRARGTNQVKTRTERPPAALPVLPPPGRSWLTACPQNRSEGLAAAAAMQARSGVLARLSPEHVRSLCRVYWLAGWTGLDCLTALEYHWRAGRHGHGHAVRDPAGWARHRLGLWLAEDGTPRQSPSQAAAALRRRELAEREARVPRPGTAPPPAWHEAREMLRKRPRPVAES